MPATNLQIGAHRLESLVMLAPMSGVTDLPFRQLAHASGCGAVVSEMIASEHLVREAREARRRAEGSGIRPFVMQLAGCEAHWMAEGARIAVGLGADIIDINMGCPAREVTGKQAGSALMRDLDHAVRLIDAVIRTVSGPVTLKMRMGWDHASLNAVELARRAEAAGVRLITVHARTRCQFFKGAADWAYVRQVKRAVHIPVVVNGDIIDPATAREALGASGADGVMIGRGAYGAPWMPARITAGLATGDDPGDPSLGEQCVVALRHVRSMLGHYGVQHGLRCARKHIGWYLERSGHGVDMVKAWRRRLCTSDDPGAVLQGIREFYSSAQEAAA